MFKFKAESGVKAETVRAEAKQGARTLRAAKKNAQKRGKKLSAVGTIVGFTMDQPALRRVLDPRGTVGKITTRGLTGKKNQRALASKKNEKRDQRAIQNALQGRSPEAAKAFLDTLNSKEGKEFQRAVRKAGGGKRLAFTIATMRKRAAGKDVGKIYKRPNPGPRSAGKPKGGTGGKPKPKK